MTISTRRSYAADVAQGDTIHLYAWAANALDVLPEYLAASAMSAAVVTGEVRNLDGIMEIPTDRGFLHLVRDRTVRLSA